MTTDERQIAEALRRSGLPEGEQGDRVVSIVRAAGVPLEHLEGLVRSGSVGRFHGRRMAIEQAPRELLHAVLDAFGGVGCRLYDDLTERAVAEGVPLIVGWDAAKGFTKYYINASDASEKVRADLWKSAGIPLPTLLPHIVGFNVPKSGPVETKAYAQSTDSQWLARHGDDNARALADRAVSLGIAAGAVMCWDLGDGPPVPRAFFVAVRDDARSTWQGMTDLFPGWNQRLIDEALPFERGSLRLIGFGIRNPEWTAYFKARGVSARVWALDPVACFRTSDAEVGVFIEPNIYAARARERTARYALNARTRQGSPDVALVDALMRWVHARVSAVEVDGDIARVLEGDPPPPWVRVTP